MFRKTALSVPDNYVPRQNGEEKEKEREKKQEQIYNVINKAFNCQ
jgi:hypothetical protein